MGISGATNSHPSSSSLPPTEVVVPPEPAPQVSVGENSSPEAAPTVVAQPVVSGQSIPTPPPLEPAPVSEAEVPAPAAPAPIATAARTQLQQVTARLIHVQSDRLIELPQNLSVIHIGKPNDRIPPDIDVSGFSNSEIVSRIHADIRVEGDAHYSRGFMQIFALREMLIM